MSAGALVDPTGTVWLTIPRGWSMADDFGAVVCEAPPAQADITGRVCAASIRIEPADRGALVPRLVAAGRRPDLASLTQDVVADTFAGDPTAVLVDARRWLVQIGGAAPSIWPMHVDGVRIDMAHHDMTTAMSTTTIFVDGGRGIMQVTASVPVAHLGGLGAVVEQALASLEVASSGPVTSPGDLNLQDGGAGWAKPASRAPSGLTDVGRLDPGSWDLRGYRPPPAAIDLTSFDVFLRGSHKISPRWRPPALAAGLIEAHGVATPMGHYVRRAVGRPDRRVVLRVWEVDGPVRAEVYVDVLERQAVLRSTAPAHFAVLTGSFPAGPRLVTAEGVLGLEVQDMAAVPARLAAWLGVGLAGPDQSFLLAPGLEAAGAVIQSMAPGVPAQTRPFDLDPAAEDPAQLWARLVALLA